MPFGTINLRFPSLAVATWGMLFAQTLSAANYGVVFEATWSATNHPNAYVSSAHFSTPIGTTHNDQIQLWGPERLASPGIEGVAETGSVRLIRSEISSAIDAGNAFGFIQGSTFDSPGTNRFGFEAIESFPLVSVVSMIAPSPDWFVGVHDLSLRDEAGWIEQLVIPLAPYDAGTEEGNRLSLANPATAPPEAIRRLDQDSESILFEAEPFGTLTFTLLPDCDLNFDGLCDVRDLNSNSGLYSVGDLTQGVPVIAGQNSRFDLNEDSTLDTRDLDEWLKLAAQENGFAEPYLRGDTNLNDHVGFGDFTALSRSFGTGVEWSDGNYDGSPNTDFTDFLALAGNFGRQIARSNAATSVPEPTGFGILSWAIVAATSIRRRRTNEASSQGAGGL